MAADGAMQSAVMIGSAAMGKTPFPMDAAGSGAVARCATGCNADAHQAVGAPVRGSFLAFLIAGDSDRDISLGCDGRAMATRFMDDGEVRA